MAEFYVCQLLFVSFCRNPPPQRQQPILGVHLMTSRPPDDPSGNPDPNDFFGGISREQLLRKWEQAFEEGRVLSARELHPRCPEDRVDELQKALDARHIECLMVEW